MTRVDETNPVQLLLASAVEQAQAAIARSRPRPRWWPAGWAAAGLLLLLAASPAAAGNDIYFVAYNDRIQKGEVELMLMSDLVRPPRTQAAGTYTAHMMELEYGVTDRWASEVMVEGFVDPGNGGGRFTGFRWENRFKVLSGKDWGVLLYAEYEDLDPATRFKMELSGREDGKGEPAGLEGRRERILETRLVLSRDLGPWNIALNWINEADLRRGAFGFTDFGYALGVRRMLGSHHHGHEHDHEAPAEECSQVRGWKPAGYGFELYGGVGNSRAFGGPFNTQQHYFQPVIMFHPARNVMVHVGLAKGLTGVSDTLLRASVGIEF